jgi:pimeloyl-ACP methyl ester carboxylesterase
MTQKPVVHPADLRGLSRLAVDATLGLTDLVETMHATIVRAPGILGPATPTATRGITGMVYRSIRGITRVVGDGIDAVLGQLMPLFGEPASSPERESIIAALNGVLGDYLAASNNPLMIPMRLRHDGQPLELTAQSLLRAIPQPRRTILLLVHGLCLNDLHWRWQGHDHGARLAADLGYTQIYLHYNTGLHISTNGHAFAALIESLLQQWPVSVERLIIIGHSMGGLVTRSACHYGALAGHAWLRQLQAIVFLGTPHHGAPLERVGNWVNGLLEASPYTAAFARLGKLRSAGITDLRYGSLLDEEWTDENCLAQRSGQRRAVPLPGGVACYTIAATTGTTGGSLRDQLLGDGLVPLDSALGCHVDPSLTVPFPATQQWIGYRMNHVDLLHRREVYEQLRHWLAR